MNPKDVLTNKHFCPMPWTGLMFNFDGSVKNCIRTDDQTGLLGNIKDTPIEEILLGSKNITKQTNITNNQPAAGCHTCYDLEHGKQGLDIISDRIFYIREFKRTPLDTYRPNNFDLQAIDVRWTNLCNLACVYCSPSFSSKWANEMGVKIETPSEQQLADFKQYIYQHTYFIQGDTSDLCVGEFGDVPHGSSDTAPAVQHLVAGLNAEPTSKVVLVAGDSHLECLARELVREVKALAPAPLVEQSGQLVVGIDEGGVAGVSTLHTFGTVVMQVIIGVNPLVYLDVSLLLLHRELREDLKGATDGVCPKQAVHSHKRHSYPDTCTNT